MMARVAIGVALVVGISLLPGQASAGVGLKRAQTSVCKAGNGFPDPSAEIVSTGPSCGRAKHVLHDFFAKAQAHGVPLTVDHFRCRVIVNSPKLPAVPVCRHRRAKIEYYGRF